MKLQTAQMMTEDSPLLDSQMETILADVFRLYNLSNPNNLPTDLKEFLRRIADANGARDEKGAVCADSFLFPKDKAVIRQLVNFYKDVLLGLYHDFWQAVVDAPANSDKDTIVFDIENDLCNAREEQVKNADSHLHRLFYKSECSCMYAFIERMPTEDLYRDEKILAENAKYAHQATKEAIRGNRSPLKRVFLFLFEKQCYSNYANVLGLHRYLKICDDGDGDENGDDEDTAADKEEEKVPAPKFNKVMQYQNDCILYYIGGATIRAVLGQFVSVAEDDQSSNACLVEALLNGLTVTLKEALSSKLPCQQIMNKMYPEGDNSTSVDMEGSVSVSQNIDFSDSGLLCVNVSLFKCLKSMENDILEPIIEDMALLVGLRGHIMDYALSRLRGHSSYEVFQEILRGVLAKAYPINPSTTSDSAEATATFIQKTVNQCLDKFYNYYLKIAINDLVLHAIPKVWKNHEKYASNLTFRIKCQIEKDKLNEQTQKKGGAKKGGAKKKQKKQKKPKPKTAGVETSTTSSSQQQRDKTKQNKKAKTGEGKVADEK
jgi:hypothetical protein